MRPIRVRRAVATAAVSLVALMPLLPLSTAQAIPAAAKAPMAAAAAWTPPTYSRTVGHPGHAGLYAWGAATAPDGTILVGDYWNYVVRRYSTSGQLLQTMSSKGLADGQNMAPHGVAADPIDGSVYIADMNNASHRIIKLAADGTFVRNVSTYVPGVTIPYAYVTHITVGADGDLYAVSSHNVPYLFSSVLVFSRDGVFKRAITGVGSGPGQLGLIHGIAVDRGGNVFLADATKGVISKFDATGAFVTTIGRRGSGPGQFPGDMRGLAVDDVNGWLYANDSAQSQVEKFTTTGTYLMTFGSEGTGNGQFRDGGRELTVGRDGNVYAPDFGNYRVLVFSPTGTFLRSLPQQAPPPPLGGFNQAQGVAVDPANGQLYVADTYNHRIQRFTADGEFAQAWGFRGSTDRNSFNYPRGIAVDPGTGDVWVANSRQGNIKHFSAAGSFIGSFGQWGTALGQYQLPRDLAVRAGRVYIADSNNRRVVVTTTAGALVWSAPCGTTFVAGQGPGLLQGCTGIDVDADGNVWAAAVTENVVYKWSATGSLMAKYGSVGSGIGQLRAPYDVAVRDGRVYVSESNNNRVSVYDTSFGYLGRFGSKGTDDGQLTTPRAIDVDNAGAVYVMDSQNERVQVFAPAS